MQTVTIEFPHAIFSRRTQAEVTSEVILRCGRLVQDHATLVRVADDAGPRWQRGGETSGAVQLTARYGDLLSDQLRSPEEFEEKLVKTMDLVWCAESMWLRFPGGAECVIKGRDAAVSWRGSPAGAP